MSASTTSILSDAVLAGCAERAAGYDRDNAFFTEDFEALKKAGYLRGPIPKELGGLGHTLAQSVAETRRLAYHAPATALGLNMHNYWMGVAADLWRSGDKSLEWMLREGAAGEVFAAGHAESGCDIPLLLSTTRAEKVDGGWKFTGRKGFGSLTPVWTRFGIHGMDASDPAAPKIVHAFMPRDTKGYRIEKTWDTMGMRATRSDDTILDGVVVPDRYIARVVPAGAAGVDMFILSIFAWALTGFGNVYRGLAQRAIDLVLPSLQSRTSIGLTRSMAYHPEVQHRVAEMVVTKEGIDAHLDRLADDWSTGADHGMAWPIKIVAAKYHGVEGAWKIVDTAMDLSGGSGMFRKNELERVFRDARAGRFHPSNSALVHELVGKMSLGISPDEQPRWG